MSERVIGIEDTSDCDSCVRRDAENFEMLVEVKCNFDKIRCPECGRLSSVCFAAPRIWKEPQP